ncbi:MAG: zf-HC2 domain-containing protein [Sciscionella sp.]
MDCEHARETLSAYLDGEILVAELAEVQSHEADCPACAAWYAQAARLDRLTRVTPVDVAEPDLVDATMATVTLPRVGRWRLPLKVALVVVALAQLGIGATNLFLPLGMRVGMPPSAHMDHESAAFNLAFGVVLLLAGLNIRRAAIAVPVLGSFVAVLAAASALDLADGNVTWSRLVTHAPIVVGLVLAAALGRQPSPQRGPKRGTGGAFATAGGTCDPAAQRAGDPTRPQPDRDRPPAARRKVA